MNEDDEVGDAQEPFVQNFTTLVASGPDIAREIALGQAVSIVNGGHISADDAVEFAEKFLAFLQPVPAE